MREVKNKSKEQKSALSIQKRFTRQQNSAINFSYDYSSMIPETKYKKFMEKKSKY